MIQNNPAMAVAFESMKQHLSSAATSLFQPVSTSSPNNCLVQSAALFPQPFLSRIATMNSFQHSPFVFPFPRPGIFPPPPTAAGFPPLHFGGGAEAKMLQEQALMAASLFGFGTASADDLMAKVSSAANFIQSSPKRFKSEKPLCPVCGEEVLAEDLPRHFQTELENLERHHSSALQDQELKVLTGSCDPGASPTSTSDCATFSPGHQQVLEQVQRNRRKRRLDRASRILDTSSSKDKKERLDVGNTNEGSLDGSTSLHSSPVWFQGCKPKSTSPNDPEINSEDLNLKSDDENINKVKLQCPCCQRELNDHVISTICLHVACLQCWEAAIKENRCPVPNCGFLSSEATVKHIKIV